MFKNLLKYSFHENNSLLNISRNKITDKVFSFLNISDLVTKMFKLIKLFILSVLNSVYLSAARLFKNFFVCYKILISIIIYVFFLKCQKSDAFMTFNGKGHTYTQADKVC